MKLKRRHFYYLLAIAIAVFLGWFFSTGIQFQPKRPMNLSAWPLNRSPQGEDRLPPDPGQDQEVRRVARAVHRARADQHAAVAFGAGEHGRGRGVAFTSDCGPHWCPPAFVDWSGYATMWQQIVTWVAGG